tara:strand:+ start:579 stop:698 length:120 start_codon:yes stop_codon:yes gene_type:complete
LLNILLSEYFFLETSFVKDKDHFNTQVEIFFYKITNYKS